MRAHIAVLFTSASLAACGGSASPASNPDEPPMGQPPSTPTAEATPPPPAEPAATAQAPAAAEDVDLKMPEEDPGIPLYARVGRQYLHDGQWVAIPFYRDPACVPGGFDLLKFFDLPGPTGPGAFKCPLTVKGTVTTQKNAPQGTFPKKVVMESAGKGVPVWFVKLASFKEATKGGTLTMDALRKLKPLVGTASTFREQLQPREADHQIIIDATGKLDDGRAFELHLKHVGDQPATPATLPNERGRLESIEIKLK